MDERPTILPDGDWAWPDTEQPREGGYDAWTKPAGPTELTLEMPIPDYARPPGDLAGVLRDHFDEQHRVRHPDPEMEQTLMIHPVNEYPKIEPEILPGDRTANYVQQAIDAVKEVVDGRDVLDPIPEYHIYVVWFCKTLQNWKALIGTTLADGLYYEVTHDGEKNRTYVDIYKKTGQSIIYGRETHTDETMQKVYAAIHETGIPGPQVVDIVMAMQNAGILFRERDN